MLALTPFDLDLFFRKLAVQMPCRVKIILTGGAAALLMGSSRPTMDLDFGIIPLGPREKREQWWEGITGAIEKVSEETGVGVQYSEDIDRWSAIAIPNYQRHTRPYGAFGRVRVHLLEPTYWAVPKLARYIDRDVLDLVPVLRAQGTGAMHLARVCGRCLRASPRSTSLYLFRRHVEGFIREHGRSVWGDGFDAEGTISAFHRAAGIRGRS